MGNGVVILDNQDLESEDVQFVETDTDVNPEPLIDSQESEGQSQVKKARNMEKDGKFSHIEDPELLLRYFSKRIE